MDIETIGVQRKLNVKVPDMDDTVGLIHRGNWTRTVADTMSTGSVDSIKDTILKGGEEQPKLILGIKESTFTVITSICVVVVVLVLISLLVYWFYGRLKRKQNLDLEKGTDGGVDAPKLTLEQSQKSTTDWTENSREHMSSLSSDDDTLYLTQDDESTVCQSLEDTADQGTVYWSQAEDSSDSSDDNSAFSESDFYSAMTHM